MYYAGVSPKVNATVHVYVTKQVLAVGHTVHKHSAHALMYIYKHTDVRTGILLQLNNHNRLCTYVYDHR